MDARSLSFAACGFVIAALAPAAHAWPSAREAVTRFLQFELAGGRLQSWPFHRYMAVPPGYDEPGWDEVQRVKSHKLLKLACKPARCVAAVSFAYAPSPQHPQGGQETVEYVVVRVRGSWLLESSNGAPRVLVQGHRPGYDARMDASTLRECAHSRLVDASPERVFKAIADPTHLTRWFGPAGFTSTFHEFDFRRGGLWRVDLHGPDGKTYPNEYVFLDIVEPTRVVIDHLAQKGSHHFVLTITLEREGDRTRVGWRQVFDTAEHRAEIAPFVMPANEQNLDRLEDELRRM